MRTYSMFVCDVCGKESRDQEAIELCQANHLGLCNLEDYRKWKLLDGYAKACTAKLSYTNNQALRDLEEEAYNELLAFEKEHKMEDL